jgi:hypothetical protein
VWAGPCWPRPHLHVYQAVCAKLAMSNNDVKRQPRSLRPRDEAPFCWFARAALEWIERSPEITNQARAKLVYVAGHVVEASRQGKSTYAAPRDLIARHAGVSVRTVMAANAELAAAGLILIERHFDAERKRHDVSTYTLCSLRPSGSGNICLTPQANDRVPDLPTLKVNSTLKESGINEQAAPAQPGAHPASADAGRVAPGGAAGQPRPILNTW